MKKYFILTSFIIAVVFVFSIFVPITPTKVEAGTLCESVEAMVSAGVIGADKANSARTAANCPLPSTAEPTKGATATVRTYTVTLNPNFSSEKAVVEKGLKTNDKINLNNPFFRSGYEFSGWATSKTGPIAHPNGYTYTVGTVNATFYAKWKISGTFTVTFIPGDGSGIAMPTITMAPGERIFLPPNTYKNDGYEFEDWCTSGQETFVCYDDEDNFTMENSNVILKAYWKRAKNVVIFDRTQGYGTAMPPQIFEEGIPEKLNKNTYEKSGCTFLGWEGRNDTQYEDQESYTLKEEGETLYAIWSESAGTVFNLFSNGGIPADSVKEIAPNISSRLSNPFTKVGFAFDYWRSLDGSKTYEENEYYTAGETDTIINLEAMWKVAPSFIVTFNGNGGTSSSTVQTQSIVSGTSANLKANTFKKASSIFAGWAETKAGPAIYADKAIFPMGDKNVTLYAKWTPAYTVTFNSNGGSGSISALIMAANSTSSLPTNEGRITKVNNQFVGWAKTKTGAVVYADGAVFTMAKANVTLFAKWAPTITLTFNPNGGVGSVYVQNIPTNASTTLIANTFTRDGYRFIGWATTAAGAVAYADGAVYLGAANATLYAVWVPTGSTVITFEPNWNSGIPYNPKSGTGSMSPLVVLRGTTVKLPRNNFVPNEECDPAGSTNCNSYRFYLWRYSSPNYQGPIIRYYDQANFTGSGEPSVTLIANWYPAGAAAPDNHNYATVSVGWETLLKLINALK